MKKKESGAGEHNKLVSLNENQTNPYEAKASDFPAAGGTGKGPVPEGMNQLCAESEKQCGPRYNEDGGPGSSGAGTPAEWGKGGTNFTVSKQSGDGTSVSISEGIDFLTGKITGPNSTAIDSVPESKVHIA